MAEVKKEVVVSVDLPTPNWYRKIIRAATWISGTWATLLLAGVDFSDLGISDTAEEKILKVMACIALITSVLGRGIGEKPVHTDTDQPLRR
jgi:hypothetical protein